MIFSIKWQVGIISLCRNFQNFPLVSLGKWNLKIVETSQTMAHVIFSWFWRSDNRTPILNVLIMVEDVGEKCMKLYVGNFTNIQLHQHSENSRPTHFLSPTYFTNVYSPFFLHTVPWWFWTNLFDMSWYDFISRHSCWPFRWRILLLIIYIGEYHVLLFAENSFY